MTEKAHFRPFTETDLPELKAMILELYAEDAQGEPMSEHKIRCTVRELLRHPQKGRVIIFCVAEAAVGYAIVIYSWSNEYGGHIATIDELYVRPPWRGQGIGSDFLGHIAASGDDSVKGLRLEVTPANERALDYYLRQGFGPVANLHLFKKL
jgi:ribosomal protein S18 acetylase RimI-like enzyme